MHALTIRQPWASLIIAGQKDIENRTWKVDHRGPLAIHAGKIVDAVGMKVHPLSDAPRGVVLGVVDLIDVVEGHPSPWAESGCYHWVLANPRPLNGPVPFSGRYGLFVVPDRLLTT